MSLADHGLKPLSLGKSESDLSLYVKYFRYFFFFDKNKLANTKIHPGNHQTDTFSQSPPQENYIHLKS